MSNDTTGTVGAVNLKKSIRANTIGVFIMKGVSMASSYFVVPLLIGYLDVYRYGIWITIFSIINWFQFFDMGLGNGLRNKYAESIAAGDNELAKIYVSTTYFLITLITLGMMVILGILYPIVNWHEVFNIDQSVGSELNWLILVVFSSFILSFPLKLINSLLYGAQKSGFANTIGSVANIISLLMIYFFIDKNGSNNLLKVGIIYTYVPLVLFLLVNIYFFAVPFKSVTPSIKHIKTKYIKDLTGLGIKFFILQVNALVLFSSNSFIIAHTLGQASVSEYNVMFKFYSIPNMLFTIILTPYWSAFTNAYVRDDVAWIKKNMKILLGFLGMVVLLSVVLLVFNKYLFHLWVGNKVKTYTDVGLWMVIYLFIQSAMLMYVNFINGTGKIQLQLYIATVVSIVNIPICIFFIKNLGWGLNGCIIANIICTTPFFVLMAIQTNKMINKTATGIWNG